MIKEATLLNAVTADTTSAPFNIEHLNRVGLQFLASGITSGNGVFTVEGTIDGQNWVALNILIDNVTNTNAQNQTRVASKTLSSNTSVIVWLENLGFKAIRVVVDKTTDGTYSAFVIAHD